uniref:cytochrome P450 2G1-like n=1 Tax=Podarcis muralis TaxID=64176 RepID=UPI00109FEDB8|nr:cytochrome P450 2G1-like [Podarcis muralis]
MEDAGQEMPPLGYGEVLRATVGLIRAAGEHPALHIVILSPVHTWANLRLFSRQLGEAYGSVFTVYLGLQRVVVLSSYNVVKEALVDQAEDFNAIGQIPSFSKDFNDHGVTFSNGDRWRQLRRFSLTTLRNFGMGKRSIEERIQEEAWCLAEEFRKLQGRPLEKFIIKGLGRTLIPPSFKSTHYQLLFFYGKV